MLKMLCRRSLSYCGRNIPSTTPNTDFVAWALSCRARFKIYEYYKENKRAQQRLSNEAVRILERESQKSNRDSDSHLEAIKRCMSTLNIDDYKLIKLRYELNEKVENIASRFGCSHHRIYRSLTRIHKPVNVLRNAISSTGKPAMNQEQQFKYGQMILLALDGKLSDEQFAQFDRLLKEDPVFRQYYLNFMDINASINAIDKFPVNRVDLDEPILDEDEWLKLAEYEKSGSGNSYPETSRTKRICAVSRLRHLPELSKSCQGSRYLLLR